MKRSEKHLKSKENLVLFSEKQLKSKENLVLFFILIVNFKTVSKALDLLKLLKKLVLEGSGTS